MDTVRLRAHQKWIQEELERCTAFWLEHGMDREGKPSHTFPVQNKIILCGK